MTSLADNKRVAIRVVTRSGLFPARKTMTDLLDADGDWVPLGDDNPLVTSAQCRRYWAKKSALSIEIGCDDSTGSWFGRVLAR